MRRRRRIRLFNADAKVSCKYCGKAGKAVEFWYNVDGNNIAITNNAPPVCNDCKIENKL